MSWYKKAFPMNPKTLIDRDPQFGYIGIGHHHYPALTHGRLPNFKDIVEEGIWAITKDFKVISIPVTHKNAKDTHRDLNLDDPDKFVAKGRYEFEKDSDGNVEKRVSLVPIFRLEKKGFMGKKKKEYMLNKITESLDNYYDNPQIYHI